MCCYLDEADLDILETAPAPQSAQKMHSRNLATFFSQTYLFVKQVSSLEKWESSG